ncbi:hypothetical protein [Roseimaritima ulvae]|uniref:ZIP Zinc transporter n=1 Tax=Roseimaritima ulvae TaxID=980254 RepID=A0A5B9QZE5_9BACT|nr:hypothetical protein [Roseimaritima ulvae]QEG39371.1 ZIP Zinc transporter [Roseimaritima ulvae]
MASLIGALFLAAVHLFGCKLRFLDVIPRSRWLSIAGGVAVAYALLHLLPELNEYHGVLQDFASDTPFDFIASHVIWFFVLLGLLLFYGLEKAALSAKADSQSNGVFWVHMGAYAFYNGLLGYLLVREYRDVTSLTLFVIGIGLHFFVNDHALRQHHRKPYHRRGRWILAAAILLGWAVGMSTEIHEVITATVIAFLSGGILLNSFKEELPEERESHFGSFASGAVGYALLLTLT